MQSMQTLRRLFAVLAALSVATLLVAGCTISKKAKGGPLPDPAATKALVSQSTQLTKGVKSAQLDLTVNGKIPELPLKTLSGELTTVPTTAGKGNARIIAMGSEVQADFVILDGELYTTALTPGTWTDFGNINELLHYDPSALLSPETGVANVLAHLDNPKAEGRDIINGQTALRISGTVDADTVNKLAPLNAKGPTPTTVWIVETGDHQLARVLLDKGSGNSVQMTLSKWNVPVQVTKPVS